MTESFNTILYQKGFQKIGELCFELNAETRYITDFTLRAGYTYMDTENKSPNTAREELQYRPEHKLTIDGRYVFDFGLQAYASVMHVANQYYYSRNTPLQKRKLNDYTVVNINAEQVLLKKRLKIYAGIDNLFDKNYEEAYGFPREGRTVYAGVELRF